MELREALDLLGERINERYPAINEGGCCVFASIVGAELEKRGIETQIIVAAWCGDDGGHKADLSEIRGRVNNNSKTEWNNEGVYFNHVGVEFRLGDDVFHYDSDGVHPEDAMLKSWRIYPGRISVDDAKALAAEAEGWNTSFDRKNIPGLRLHVNRFLASKLPLPA